jgi:hypothetical protein
LVHFIVVALLINLEKAFVVVGGDDDVRSSCGTARATRSVKVA